MTQTKEKGISLAKGPVALIGLALLAYGILALIFGGHGFGFDFPSGTENGKKFLGLEGNGWTNLLFIAAGALLVFGSPLHWGAKSLSLIVGLVLGAASVIALVDGDDVFGMFAANGLTKLVWGIAAAVLIVLSLLPRVGDKKDDDEPPRRREAAPAREPAVERGPARFERPETVVGDAGSRRNVDSRVVAPASGTTAESRETTRRQREDGIS